MAGLDGPHVPGQGSWGAPGLVQAVRVALMVGGWGVVRPSRGCREDGSTSGRQEGGSPRRIGSWTLYSFSFVTYRMAECVLQLFLPGGGISHQGGSLGGDDQVSSRYDRLPPFIGPVLGGVDDARRTLDVGGLVLDDHESVVGALHPAVLSIAEILAAGCAVPVGWS